MAVVRKTNAGATNNNKVVAKPETKATTKPVSKAPVKKEEAKEVKKPVAKAETKKVEVKKPVAKKEEAKAPVKKSVAKAPVKPATTSNNKGGKFSLKKTDTKSKSFEIKVGGQATQDAFIDIFHKKLISLTYGVSKEEAKKLMKAYSETLKEVTSIASFQDTTSGIFYGRRMINTRVTNPPKAADGLQTLMLVHPEIKVRKQLADDSQIKFFGHLSEEDANIFITVDGEEINIAEMEEKLLSQFMSQTTTKAKSTKAVSEDVSEDVEEDVEEEYVEEDLVEEEADELDEEASEELEADLEEEDDLEDDFEDDFEDEDEE